MTAVTSVRRVRIIAVQVAKSAVVGNRHVRTVEGINRCVVESRRCPSSFGMARLAVGRKLVRCMVRVGCGSVIVCVAAVASVRRGIVIPVVAGSAVVGNQGMSAIQNIKIVVNGKRRRRPTRLGRVASRTIRRQAQRHVIRVG